MKTFLLSLLIATSFFGFSLAHAAAQTTPSDTNGTDYHLLSGSIPNISDSTGKTNLATFIPGLIKLIIGLAGALAVIQIVIGGFQYIMTEAVGGKSSAKDTIQNAIIGLLLAIASYTILYTINPRLVELNLKLEYQGATQATDLSVGGIGNIPGGDIDDVPASQGIPPGASANKSWPPDNNVRSNFAKNTNGLITFNHPGQPGCATIGQQNCTSVAGISTAVQTGLSQLAIDCKCSIEITGGTEYWLHGNRSTELTGPTANKTAHKSGGRVVDISLYTPVSQYIRAEGEVIKSGDKSGDNCVKFASGPERYQIGNGLYVNEKIAGNDPHWHVCFN
ncbi:MAG: pilin [Patescibacteria group bacterium]